MKKKNCKKVTSYNCGNSCINEKYICRKVGLAGQSVNIADRLAAAIEKLQASTPVNPEPEIKAAAKAAKVTKTKTTKKLKDKAKKAAAKPKAEPKAKPAAKPKSKKLTKKAQLAEHYKLFNRDMSQAEKVQVMKDLGVTYPTQTVSTIYSYTMNDSQRIKYDDFRGLDKVEGRFINDFIDKAPAFEGEIYSGFAPDMDEVFKLNELEVGQEFKLPSITSFTSSLGVAKGFNGGGIIKVINNKTAPSIAAIAGWDHELEVLSNKKPTYKLVNKTKSGKSTVYELEEI